MASTTEQWLEPESEVGTVLSLVATAVVFLVGLALVAGGVVARPRVTSGSLLAFALGVLSGIVLTAATHRSPTFRRAWARVLVRFAVTLATVLVVMVLLWTGTLPPTALFVWGMGLLPAGAVTRVLLYLRTRDPLQATS